MPNARWTRTARKPYKTRGFVLIIGVRPHIIGGTTRCVQHRVVPHHEPSLLEDRHMAAHHDINPSTQILDAAGYDWAWVFVWFKDVVGFPGYSVGSNGSVWSSKSSTRSISRRYKNSPSWPWYRLSPHLTPSGHLMVGLTDATGKLKTRLVHRLVLEAFVGPRPEGQECCHSPDQDPTNNRLRNLRWDTKTANQQEASRLGRNRTSRNRGENNPRTRLTVDDVVAIRELRSAGTQVRLVAEQFGVSPTCIRHITSFRSWKDLSGGSE
jgi:hypothetical protein